MRLNKMNLKIYLFLLATAMVAISGASGMPGKRPGCTCMCPFNDLNVCETVNRLKTEVDINTAHSIKWMQDLNFVRHFRQNWREEISNIVETTIKDYIARGMLHQKPKTLVETLEDGMVNDAAMLLRPSKEDSGLAKNVSSLVEKVEMVENRTREVENELKTERRVRRDLEAKVNKTHTSLVLIEDQLQNVSAPVDAMVTEVEMKLHASIEDLQKTIYEDHLKKLYYQVEGVVYKNETKKLDERLESIEGELHDGSNISIVSKFAGEIRNLEENLYLLNNSIGDVVVPRLQTLNKSIGDVLIPRLQTLEADTVRKDAAAELEDKMKNLLKDTEIFKIALGDVLSSVQDVQDLENKFQDFSEYLTRSLGEMEKQIEFLKNEAIFKPIDNDSDDVIEISRLVQLNSTDIIPPDDGTSTTEFETSSTTESDDSNLIELESNEAGDFEETNDVVEYQATTEESGLSEFNVISLEERSRMAKELEKNSTHCDVPVIDDPHLLVDVVQNEEGRQTLKFGCKPIGRYIVPPVPVPPRCENGTWRNPVPSCNELPSEKSLESLAEELLKENPCNLGSGEFPDPTNCSQFFKCAHGTLTVIPCPHGLRFNSILKVCDYPRTTGCYADSSKHVEELQAMIPPVHIEPDNLDRPSSLLGTGKTGELIVYPRSSFTLHCLYPESMYGDPKWNVSYFHPGVNPRVLTPHKGTNRMSLTITAAKEEDSGIYRCLTPFGLKHDVIVTVKAVICPALPMEAGYEDVFYRPTPEGDLRILGTAAEMSCEDGHKVTLHCMANGAWSRQFPSEEECKPKKRSDDKMWNCTPLDLSEHPDLIVERKDEEKIVTFKCAGKMRLIGNTFTRCLDEGFWSHTFLPYCKK